MSVNRLKVIVAAVVIVVMVILMLWFPNHARHAEVQRIIDQADLDVSAAKAAADSAADSAAKAKDSARDAQNRLPGSS
jgi:hypothetical protein